MIAMRNAFICICPLPGGLEIARYYPDGQTTDTHVDACDPCRLDRPGLLAHQHGPQLPATRFGDPEGKDVPGGRRGTSRHSGQLEELDVEGILAFAERILP